MNRGFLSFFWKRPLLAGIAGGIGLLVIFFGLMLATSPLAVAIVEFKRIWIWILALVLGFGIQAYLYATLKKSSLESSAASKGIAASGGMTTTSMIACCAHHFTDVLPFLGLAALATFLSRYQEFFLLIGVLSNAVGIVMMLSVFKKMKLDKKCPILKRVSRRQMEIAFKASIVASVAIIAVYAARFLI